MGNVQEVPQQRKATPVEHAELDVHTIVHSALLSKHIYSNESDLADFTRHIMHDEDKVHTRPTKWGIWLRDRNIFLSIRGSKISMDWITNVGALPSETGTNGLKIHSGYVTEINLEYREMIGNLSQILRDPPTGGIDRIIVTGHSKGGGLSHVLIHKIMSDPNPTNDPYMDRIKEIAVAITFASPMVFSYAESTSQEVQNAVTSIGSSIHNFVVLSDPVPHLPLALHANIAAIDRLATASAGNYLRIPMIANLKDHLLAKVKDVGEYSHSYKPVGTLYAASSDDLSKAIFKQIEYDSFLRTLRDATLTLNVSHHAMDTYTAITHNLARDFQSFHDGAIAGDPDDQFHLACCFETGRGVSRDERKAFEWYSKSAAGGHQHAQLKVALCYALGRGGVVANSDRADMMYGMVQLHHTHLTDYTADLVEWYTHKANMGDAAYMAELAEWYRTGACGLAKNEDEALRLYRLSAEQNDPRGQAYLGVCYQYGLCGLAKNEEEALRLYRLSAEQNDPRGQAYLGKCYQYGLCGLAKNEDEALRLYRLSAEQNDPRGQAYLGNCYQNGLCGLAKNKDEALRLYRLSAEQNDPQGQYFLGAVMHNRSST